MREAHTMETSSRPMPRPTRRRGALGRAVAAGAIVIGTLAVAAPSWAGPLTGCC